MAAGTRSKNVLFEGCVIGDTAHLALYVNRAQDVIIRNCVTFHTGDPAWLQADGDPGASIVIGDEMSGEKSDGWQFSENVVIEGCLFVGGAVMFQVRYGLKPGNKPGAWDGYGTQIQNLEVCNCTFVSGSRTKLGVNISTGPDKKPIKAVLTGNLFVFDVMRPNGDPFRVMTKGVTFERNAWSIPVPAGLPASNVRVPALALVAPFATPDAALLLDNYRPRPGSVAVGYGALEPLPVEPPPDPEPAVDWAALRALAAEATAEMVTASMAVDKATRLLQALDNWMREYEVAAQGGKEKE